MNCQRCSKNQAGYLCSVCNRTVCFDCKIIDNGKVYCLDHDPTRHAGNQEAPQKPKPQYKTLMDIIYADVIMLIGVSFIFYFSNTVISGMINSNFNVIMKNFPQLGFVFTLLQYFTSFGLYTIIILIIILIASITVLVMKKRKDKNI
jgi:hypothetical protein